MNEPLIDDERVDEVDEVDDEVDEVEVTPWLLAQAEAEPYEGAISPEPEPVLLELVVPPTRPPKSRPGGFHPSPLPGEVGPCTRCGWVWYPDQRTIRRRPDGIPLYCANCRNPEWQMPPRLASFPRAFTPEHPKWEAQREANRKRRERRHQRRLGELAQEFGKELVDKRAASVPANVPVAQPRPHVIPPPPGLEDGK